MIIFVVTLNLAIALANLYLAFKIWQLKRKLSAITTNLIYCEQIIRTTFNSVSDNLTQLERVYTLKQKYQKLQQQLVQIRQIIILLNWGYQVWRKSRRPNDLS